MRDILSIHNTICPNFGNQRRKLQLSCDGVSESLSTTITLDVYSVKFEGCRVIYPIRIIRPLVKNPPIDHSFQLHEAISEIYVNNCEITQFIADNPKRSTARECLCFSSWYPCEYCFAKGTKIMTNLTENTKERKKIQLQKDMVEERIEALRQLDGAGNRNEMNNLKKIQKDLIAAEKKLKPKKSHIVWPKTSRNGPPRTREEIDEIVGKIENNQEMTEDDRKGIKGRSLFLDIPGFNFVNNVPVEYLHLVCLGNVKKCVELTFKVTDGRKRVTKRKLSLPSQFNIQISTVKSVREFNRRIRDLHFSVYKGQEFRNLLLFFFPLVLNCIEPGHKERDMWLYFTYMIKSCIVPTEEFRQINLDVVEKCTKLWYSLYQQLFGVHNCTYSTHIMGSHLIESRFHGPLTSTSAFPFESFYSELRNSFVPGTPSPLKQIFSNVLLKRALENHKCKQDIYYSAKDSPQECNSLVYLFEQRKYILYKIIDINEDIFTVNEQEYLPCNFPETPSLNWDVVGVFMKGNLKNEMVTIDRNSIKGKVLEVQNYLITCPANVLREK